MGHQSSIMWSTSFQNKQSKLLLMAPLKKGVYCFATVGVSVGVSVCRPSVVRSISFDPFTWSIPNLVQGLPQWEDDPYWFSRSHVQRSRSKHSSQPNVLSAQYLLTPSLVQFQTWCRGCTQWVDDPYWFSGHMFKGQGQTTLCCPLYIFLWLAYLPWTGFATTEKINLNYVPWGHICFWNISCFVIYSVLIAIW